MSSLFIVRDIHTRIQKQLMPALPKRWTKQFEFGMQAFSLRSFASANGNARKVLYSFSLRVIRSRKPKGGEPWYILTNDMQSTDKKILRIYRHRFEIEETFKDMKHIFELKRTRLNKPTSLKIILWLVSLGIVLLYLTTKGEIQANRLSG